MTGLPESMTFHFLYDGPGRGFPVFVRCRRHGWTIFPVGSETAPACEICGADSLPMTLMFTSKAQVRRYERDLRSCIREHGLEAAD